MTTTPAATILRVRRRLVDTDVDIQNLSDDTVDEAVLAALERYSQIKPGHSTVNITGDGTSFYAQSNLTGFVDEWSEIMSLEYPAEAVSSTHTPIFLDPTSDWTWYRDASTKYLWLPNHSPAATETVRVTFTIPRVLTSASNTVISSHLDAVLALSCGYCCLFLAGQKAGTSAPMVNADIANFEGAQRRYTETAREFINLFNERMGVGDKTDIKAAGVRHDWDLRGTARGKAPRLTHWGRT